MAVAAFCQLQIQRKYNGERKPTRKQQNLVSCIQLHLWLIESEENKPTSPNQSTKQSKLTHEINTRKRDKLSLWNDQIKNCNNGFNKNKTWFLIWWLLLKPDLQQQIQTCPCSIDLSEHYYFVRTSATSDAGTDIVKKDKLIITGCFPPLQDKMSTIPSFTRLPYPKRLTGVLIQVIKQQVRTGSLL